MGLMETHEEARKAATQVVKDNKSARVKIGQTNGSYVLHVMVDRQSRTYKDTVDWELSDWNERTRKRKKKKRVKDEDTASYTEVKDGLDELIEQAQNEARAVVA